MLFLVAQSGNKATIEQEHVKTAFDCHNELLDEPMQARFFYLLEGITRWPYRVHFPHCDGCDGLVTNGCRLRERANHKVLQVDYKNSIEGNECCHGNHSHRLTLGLCVDFQMILKLVTYSFPAAKNIMDQ